MPSFLTPRGPLTHDLVEDVARYLAAQRGMALQQGATSGAWAPSK